MSGCAGSRGQAAGGATLHADGSEQRRLTRSSEIEKFLAWSPNGKKIAFVSGDLGGRRPPQGSEIYVVDADDRGLTNLTRGPGGGGSPARSPDGRRIAFWSLRDGNGEVYVVNADGSRLRRLTRTPGSDGGPVWSRNGRKIFFERFFHNKSDVYVMNADGSRQRNLSRNPAPPRNGRDGSIAVSPDGRRIVFVSERDGSGQIYVMNADGSGLRRLTRRSAV